MDTVVATFVAAVGGPLLVFLLLVIVSVLAATFVLLLTAYLVFRLVGWGLGYFMRSGDRETDVYNEPSDDTPPRFRRKARWLSW